jgi:hypothetical protein
MYNKYSNIVINKLRITETNILICYRQKKNKINVAAGLDRPPARACSCTAVSFSCNILNWAGAEGAKFSMPEYQRRSSTTYPPPIQHPGPRIFCYHTNSPYSRYFLEPAPSTRGVRYLIADPSPAENSEHLRTNDFRARLSTHRCSHACKTIRVQVSPTFNCNRASQHLFLLIILINKLYLFWVKIYLPA